MRSSTAASGSGLPNPVNVVNDTNPIPAEGSPPVTIASVARECSQAFKEYSKRPYPGTEQDMERRHSRFLKLVSDLAIDRDSTYPSGLGYILSLDAILDKDDSTKGKLIRLLSFMVQHIRRAIETSAQWHISQSADTRKEEKSLSHSDGSSTSSVESFNTFISQMSQVNPLGAVKIYLKRLQQMAILIRATRPEVKFLSISHKGHDSYWDFAHAFVSHIFSMARSDLRDRIAATMVLRRGRLIQLRREQSRGRPATRPAKTHTKKGQDEIRKSTALLTATAVVSEHVLYFRKLRGERTESSLSRNVGQHIPRAPRPLYLSKHDDTFECRFCSRELPWMTQKEWRAHALKDLEPFVCTDPTCSQPLQTFGSHEAWESHLQTHRLRWFCDAPAHDGMEIEFESAIEFENHLQTVHAGTVIGSQIPFLSRNNARPSPSSPSECPLCAEPFDGDLETRKTRSLHIHDHLLMLAMQSVRTMDVDYEADYDTEPSEVDPSETSPVSWRSYQDWAGEGLEYNDDNGEGELSWETVAQTDEWPHANAKEEWGFVGSYLSTDMSTDTDPVITKIFQNKAGVV